MDKTKILQNLKKVKRLADVSKVGRFLNNPYKYIKAVGHRKIVYPTSRNEVEVVVSTFFGKKMHVLLPASTDIYLTGGKSHDSEIRLAKFMIQTLKEGDVFIDIGAHYGYFSLLASTLVGQKGRVECFEASPKTYAVLNKNVKKYSNINQNHRAVSNLDENLEFYQFPNLYSEYNTMDVTQFENEIWFEDNKPEKVTVPSLRMDDFLSDNDILSPFVKIDVEGAEDKVIKGMKDTLVKSVNLTLVMEFLSRSRGNSSHLEAHDILLSADYLGHTINEDGSLSICQNVQGHLDAQNLESDNIVYIRQMS